MSKLPNNWSEVDLGAIVERMTNGSSLKQFDVKGEGMIPITRIETIAFEKIDLSRVKYVEASKMDIETFGLRHGDILFSHINSDKHLGKTAIKKSHDEIIHGINLLLIRTNELCDSFYLNYFFKYYRGHGRFLEIAQRAVNQSSINQKKLKAIKLPLAPLPEQKRIVAKLDTLFAHLDQLKARLEKIPGLLKQFRQAVLTQAVTGKLTEEWRAKHCKNTSGFPLLKESIIKRKDNWIKRKLKEFEASDQKPKNESWIEKYVEPFEIETILFAELPEDWANATWDQITDWVTYGFTRPMPHYEQGKPIVTGKNVLNGHIDFEDVVYTDQVSYSELSDKDKPLRGDLLITKDGTIGRASVVETDQEFCINQSVAVAWMRGYKLDRKFLLYVILSETTQNEIKLKSKGVAVQHLSVTDFRKMHVPIPSAEEQSEIVRRAESLFAMADRIEARYKTLQEKIDQLPQAILSKAFRGELVAQEMEGEVKKYKEQLGEIEMAAEP